MGEFGGLLLWRVAGIFAGPAISLVMDVFQKTIGGGSKGGVGGISLTAKKEILGEKQKNGMGGKGFRKGLLWESLFFCVRWGMREK